MTDFLRAVEEEDVQVQKEEREKRRKLRLFRKKQEKKPTPAPASPVITAPQGTSLTDYLRQQQKAAEVH